LRNARTPVCGTGKYFTTSSTARALAAMFYRIP
jgi:hypothetical protein